MILDTSFLIDVMRGDGDAVEELKKVESSQIQQKVASITILELYEGVERTLTSTEEKEKVERVLGSKPVVSGDASVMERAGRLSGQLRDDGEQIDREDCIVASTALKEGEPVLTGNDKHFKRIDGIEIRTYR